MVSYFWSAKPEPGYFDWITAILPESRDNCLSLLSENQNPIMIGTAATAALFVAVRWFNNRPQYPEVKMEASLNRATLTIRARENKKEPDQNIVFCIDQSLSMNGDREQAVKSAFPNIVNAAAASKQKVTMAAVGFASEVSVIFDPVIITKESCDNIIKKIQKYESHRGTEIIPGFDEATKRLKSMQKTAPSAKPSLILLTDANEIPKDPKTLSSIHERLKKIRAHLFVIGVGKEHNKKAAKNLAFAGQWFWTKWFNTRCQYIDASKGAPEITKSIASIYQQLVNGLSDLTLSCKHLKPTQWNISRSAGQKSNGYSLENLPPGKPMSYPITVNTHGLDGVDLSKLLFRLSFKDARGKQGTVSLPWKGCTVIKSHVLNQST